MTLRKPRAGLLGSGGLKVDMFNQQELAEIHRATLEVLEHTGIFVQKEEARQLFAKHGAVVNEKEKSVRIPPFMVNEAIKSAPETLYLAGRDPSQDVILDGRRVTFTCFGEGITIDDPWTGEHRPTNKDDLRYITRIIDSLDCINVVERAVGSQEVPPQVQSVHNYEAMVTNTSKHCFVGPGDGRNLKTMLKMARAAVGEERYAKSGSPLSFITCPVSPLKLVDDCCDIIMTGAELDACVCILSMAMAGGSSPVHLTGTLVTHNAEVLAGIVLSQLTKKGAKVMYGSSTTAMYLKQASACVGSPELAMINAAVACLARYYLLPSWVAGG